MGDVFRPAASASRSTSSSRPVGTVSQPATNASRRAAATSGLIYFNVSLNVCLLIFFNGLLESVLKRVFKYTFKPVTPRGPRAGGGGAKY